MHPSDCLSNPMNGCMPPVGGIFIDKGTGFVPAEPPLHRLPAAWEPWEANLDAAVSQKLKLAARVEEMDMQRGKVEESKSKEWRKTIDKMAVLSIDGLKGNERALRRAHHVLSYLLQFYAQTVPPPEPITIPRSLSIPLLQVSKQLQHPSIITYSDHAIYNWNPREPCKESTRPVVGNFQCQTTFTGTVDEEELWLNDICVELRGGGALTSLRLATHEASIPADGPYLERVTEYLERAAAAIQEMREQMLSITKRTKPDFFWNEIVPWVRGADSDPWGRQWVFEGREEVEGWQEMLSRLAGPTAGQSSLMPALDAYLGVEADIVLPVPSTPGRGGGSYRERMGGYMPRQHRALLEHIRSNGSPLRALAQRICVEQGREAPIVVAYNAAVRALKEFRDAHIIIATMYVLGPARRARKIRAITSEAVSDQPGNGKDRCLAEQALGGNGGKDFRKAASGGGRGTDLIRLLKGFRDQTANAYLK